MRLAITSSLPSAGFPMRMLHRIYEKLLVLSLILAALMIAFMAITVSADVILRNLEWGNLPWVVEISEYILFLATFLAAPWVMHQDGHTRVDVVIQLLPRKAAEAVMVAGDILVLAVCIFLLFYGLRTDWEAYRLNGIICKQLSVPEWWLLAAIPFCGLLLTGEFILRLLSRMGWAPDSLK